jgi:hypothetical protein
MIAIVKRPDVLLLSGTTVLLGNELTNDPTLATGGDWWEGDGSLKTFTSGSVNLDSLSSKTLLTSNGFTEYLKTYKIRIVVTALSSGSLDVRHAGSVGNINSIGTHEFTFTRVQAVGFYPVELRGNASSGAIVSEFSVKEIIGDTPIQIKSNWIAAFNPIIYEFQVLGLTDPTYYVLIEIYNKETGQLIARKKDKPYGENYQIDISTYLKPLLKNEYGYPVDSYNTKSQSDSIGFFIKYSENTSAVTGTMISDEGFSFYATNSAKQIGDQYGQNMALYVPVGKVLESGGEDVEARAMWLTKFDQPVYCEGYPFSISFLYSELIVGAEIKQVVEYLDINKNVIGIHEYNLDESQGKKINYLNLIDNYPDNVAYVNWYLKAGEATPEGYVSMGYVAPGYTQ